MVDYSKGNIYQICNIIDDDVYVGSTVELLAKRMTKHKYAAKKKYYNSKLLDKMNEYGFDNFFIKLIEEFPCDSKVELLAREGHFIREIGTLNKVIAGRTHEQWYVNNLDKIAEQRKNNPNYTAKVVCECGLEVSQRHLNSHKLTKTHQRRMGVEEEHVISHYDLEKQAKYREAHREQAKENNRKYRERQKLKKQG